MLLSQLRVPPPDSIRAAARSALAGHEYVWIETPDPWRVVREFFQRLIQWLNDFGESHPVGRIVLISGLVLVLVAIFVHLGYVVYYLTRAKPETAASSAASATVPRDIVLLRQAEELAAAGRYAEAMGHRFTATLLRLDRRHFVRFHSSKTPAEYRGEAALPDWAREQLDQLIVTLYRHAFAGVPCGEEDWSRFDRTAAALA